MSHSLDQYRMAETDCYIDICTVLNIDATMFEQYFLQINASVALILDLIVRRLMCSNVAVFYSQLLRIRFRKSLGAKGFAFCRLLRRHGCDGNLLTTSIAFWPFLAPFAAAAGFFHAGWTRPPYVNHVLESPAR